MLSKGVVSHLMVASVGAVVLCSCETPCRYETVQYDDSLIDFKGYDRGLLLGHRKFSWVWIRDF